MSNRIITSFGSAFIQPEDPLYTEIVSIGKVIAEKGYTVCSGGYYGTMEAISKGAKEAGGKTIGVTVKEWIKIPNPFIDEEVKMRNLMERIVELVGLADAYVVFKGGTGTLVEISVALEMMKHKSMGEKKLIFYTEFWRSLIDTLSKDTESLDSLIKRNILFINSPEELRSLI